MPLEVLIVDGQAAMMEEDEKVQGKRAATVRWKKESRSRVAREAARVANEVAACACGRGARRDPCVKAEARDFRGATFAIVFHSPPSQLLSKHVKATGMRAA